MRLPILEIPTAPLRLAAFAFVLLSGCAGTIRQDQRVQGDLSRMDGIAQVVALMSPEAAKLQVDNPQFNREELASRLRMRLEARNLTSAAATHRVEIVLTDIRVRGAFAAIMFGFMAGDDHVVGRVRVVDAAGHALRSFEINASYALGGIAGGQDSVRISWLYDKFADLAADELQKVISPPANGGAAIAAAAVDASAPMPMPMPMPMPRGVVAVPMNSAQLVSTGVALDNVEAVPVSERGRAAYREWLTHNKPRAFVIASNGWFYSIWGTRPADPMDPTDPLERAMKRCQDAGRPDCTPYAVDDRVVYIRPNLSAPR